MATSIARKIFSPDLHHRENPLREEYLPESDGKPMAETDRHRDQMLASLHALQEYYRPNSQVYVSGNIFVYYLDENGERQSVSPDILVVFGVEKRERRTYKIDEEGKSPDVVIELTSTSTKAEDLVLKHYIYANLAVREYFLFDPYGETIRPALRGFRLEGGEYVPLPGDALRSEALGLELKVENNRLRFYDPGTGERLRTPEEAEADRRAAEKIAAQEFKARREAEAKATQELKARHQAEARAAEAEAEAMRLREELAKLRSKLS